MLRFNSHMLSIWSVLEKKLNIHTLQCKTLRHANSLILFLNQETKL